MKLANVRKPICQSTLQRKAQHIMAMSSHIVWSFNICCFNTSRLVTCRNWLSKIKRPWKIFTAVKYVTTSILYQLKVFLYMYFILTATFDCESCEVWSLIAIKAQLNTWIHRAADHTDRRISVLHFHTISAKWRLQNNEEAAQRQKRWCLKSSIYSTQPEIAEDVRTELIGPEEVNGSYVPGLALQW